MLVDTTSYSPSDILAQELLRDHILETFSPLSELERQVLSLRFGLEDGRERTLKEIGEAIGKSKSTAWRREHQALAKLRTPENTAKMQEALQ